MLLICITVGQRHPRNSLKEVNATIIQLKNPMFEFFKILYTFSQIIYSNNRATRGGSNDLQSTPDFFWQLFITFVHRKKAQHKSQKTRIFGTPQRGTSPTNGKFRWTKQSGCWEIQDQKTFKVTRYQVFFITKDRNHHQIRTTQNKGCYRKVSGQWDLTL